MTQLAGRGAVQVRTVPQRVHLVDLDPVEPVDVGLQRVDEGLRLAVGERHDQPHPRCDVVEHVLRVAHAQLLGCLVELLGAETQHEVLIRSRRASI